MTALPPISPGGPFGRQRASVGSGVRGRRSRSTEACARCPPELRGTTPPERVQPNCIPESTNIDQPRMSPSLPGGCRVTALQKVPVEPDQDANLRQPPADDRVPTDQQVP